MNASNSFESLEYPVLYNNYAFDSTEDGEESGPTTNLSQGWHSSLVIKLSSNLLRSVNDSTSSSISVSFPSNINSFSRSGGGEGSIISNNEDELQLTWVGLTGAVFCVLLILSTIFGNILVLIVVAKFHRMRSVTNILLARYGLSCTVELYD